MPKKPLGFPTRDFRVTDKSQVRKSVKPPTSTVAWNRTTFAGPFRDLTLLVGLVIAAGLVSVLRGQDANWDLQNYHYYNPWAWWNGRIFDRDIAAAQLQTFHNPLADFPFFAMIQAAWPPRWIAFFLAIPTGIAAFFYAKLVRLLFSHEVRDQQIVLVTCSFLIGVTSAMGIATLGTTMNEWQVVALFIAALWLIVRGVHRAAGGALLRCDISLAGIVAGIATGAKLTAAPFAVAMCIAILARKPQDSRGMRLASAEAGLFALMVTVGVAITYGVWMYQLWTHFESPVFPYFNDWIRSPWWDAVPVTERGYGPHGLVEAIIFPFRLYGPGTGFVTEVPYRDARFPVTWTLAIVAVARLLISPWQTLPVAGRSTSSNSSAWRIVGVFFIASFIIWTYQHSIYRYIVLLDVLSGAVIVRLLCRLLPSRYLVVATVGVTVAILATTRAADWWHIDFGDQWFRVRVPIIEGNALTLITSSDPVAFALPFLPSDGQYLGVLNTINDPARKNALQASIRKVIEDHRGPLYQLTYPRNRGSLSLAEYGLERVESTCEYIETNFVTSPIEICRLTDRQDRR